MIKIDTENEIVIAAGSLEEIETDTLNIIANIYRSLKKKDEKIADIYKGCILHCIDTCFMSKEDIEKRKEEQRKDINETIDNVQKIINEMKSLFGDKDDSKEEKEDFQEDFNKFLYGEEEE